MTGVLADRMPAEMHLFRNYDIPGQHQEARSKTDSFLPLPKPNGLPFCIILCYYRNTKFD